MKFHETLAGEQFLETLQRVVLINSLPLTSEIGPTTLRQL